MPVSLIVTDEDQGNLPGNPENVIRDLKEATATPVEPSAEPIPSDTLVEPKVPEKYQGKSIEEVIEMHKHLESAYGRMANDLGTQRKLTDQLLELKRAEDLKANDPEPLPEITSGDLLDDPQGTLDKYIDAKTGSTTRQALARVQQLEMAMAQERFLSRHTDFNEITASDGFNTWLSNSPLRLQAAAAAANGDYNVADALLNDYKEYSKLTQSSPKPTNRASDPLAAARSASLESSTASNAGVSRSPGKVYRRADLIQLKIADPDTYNDPAFQAEIVKAYNEGRVK